MKEEPVCFNPMCRLHHFQVAECTHHFYVPNKEIHGVTEIERKIIIIASRKGEHHTLKLCEACANVAKLYDELIKE